MMSIHRGLCGSSLHQEMHQKRADIRKNRGESGCYGKSMAEREGFGFTPILLKMLIFSRFLLRSLLHCYNCDLQSLF